MSNLECPKCDWSGKPPSNMRCPKCVSKLHFEEFDDTTKSIIINPFTPIPVSTKSHVRGWPTIWAQRLGADIGGKNVDLSKYDKVYIDHGVNFSGSLNLFGGFNCEVFDSTRALIDFMSGSKHLVSLDLSLSECNYIDQIEKRFGSKSTCDKMDFDFLDSLETTFNKAETLGMHGWATSSKITRAIIGDSHSLAFSTKDQAVFKNNGKTLFSALESGIPEFISQQECDYYKDVTLCLGNIDIRFHVLRVGERDPVKFANRYAQQIADAQQSMGMKISACLPLPIEHEGRKIPKTGQYEGKNFFGCREWRMEYAYKFAETLKDWFLEFDTVQPPSEWFMMEGEEYAKEIMETPFSVHVSPENYNSVIDWSMLNV